jgi:hypothetical protein
MTPGLNVAVLRERSALSPIALACADLALHCTEHSRLDQPRREGTRIVLVWSETELRGLFAFSAPAPYRELPLVALRAPTPLLRKGFEQQALHALLDWFRRDGEGAALLEIRALARGGPVYRAFAEVAREREQHVLAATAADGSCTLLVGDRAWNELDTSRLPLARWAKRAAASVVYGSLDF